MKDITNETENSAEKTGVEANTAEGRNALLEDVIGNGSSSEQQPLASDKQTNGDNSSNDGTKDSLFISVMLENAADAGKALGKKALALFSADAESGEASRAKGAAKAGAGKGIGSGDLEPGELKSGATVNQEPGIIKTSGQASPEAGEGKGKGSASQAPGEAKSINNVLNLELGEGKGKGSINSLDLAEGKGKGPGDALAADGKGFANGSLLAGEGKGIGNQNRPASDGKGFGNSDLPGGEGKGRGNNSIEPAESKAGKGADAIGKGIMASFEASELKTFGLKQGEAFDRVAQSKIENGLKQVAEVIRISKGEAADVKIAGETISEKISVSGQTLDLGKKGFSDLDNGSRYQRNAYELSISNKAYAESIPADSISKNLDHSATIHPDVTPVPFPPQKHEIIVDWKPGTAIQDVPSPTGGKTPIDVVGGTGTAKDIGHDASTFNPGVSPQSVDLPASFPLPTEKISTIQSDHNVGLDPVVYTPTPTLVRGPEVYIPAPGGGQERIPEPIASTPKPTVLVTDNGLDWLARPHNSERLPQLAYVTGNQSNPWIRESQKPHESQAETKPAEKEKPAAQEQKEKPESKVHETKVEPKHTQTPEQKARQEAHDNTQKIIDAAVKSLQVSKHGPAENIIGPDALKATIAAGKLKISENERTSNSGVPISNLVSLTGKTSKVPDHVSSAENAPISNLHKNNNFNISEAKAVIQPQLVQRAMEASAQNTNLNFEHQQTQKAVKSNLANAIEANAKIASTANQRSSVSLKGMEEAGKSNSNFKVWSNDASKLRTNLVSERGNETSVAARQNALRQIAASTASDINASTDRGAKVGGISGIARQEMEAAQLLVNRLSGVVKNKGFVDSKVGIPGAISLPMEKTFSMPQDNKFNSIKTVKTAFKPTDLSSIKSLNSHLDTSLRQLEAGRKQGLGLDNKIEKSEKEKLEKEKLEKELLAKTRSDSALDLPIDPASQERSPASTAFLLALVLSMSGMSRRRQSISTDGLEEIIYSIDRKDDKEKNYLNANRMLHRRTHMVESGETLQSIGEKYFADARVAWLIADLNSNNVDEHGIDEKRVVELKTRQSIELPEPQEVSEFLFSLPRDFDIDQKLITLVTDTMVNLEILKQFLGPLLGASPAGEARPPADPRRDLLGDFTIMGADCA